MLSEVLKSCAKIISADLKAGVKQQKMKEPVSVSYNFVRSTVLWGNFE